MASAGSGGDETFAVRGLVPSREEVATDVRKVVGTCRSRGDFQRLGTPALDRLLALRTLGHDDGPELLARAIEAVEPERYRRFLQLLLPLPFQEGERWPSLGPSRRGPGRGDLAAAEFGLDTWDGCTRPSITLDDRSRRDWAELHLATALILVATGEADGRDAVADVETVLPVATRWRPRLSVFGAALAGLLVLALITVFLVRLADGSSGSEDGSAPAGTVDRSAPTERAASPVPEDVLGAQCVRVGELDAETAAEADAQVNASTLRAVYDREAQTTDLGCAIEPAHRWHGLLVQQLESPAEDPPAAVVVTAPSAGVVLGPSQWGSYQRIGSGDGRLVQEVAGVPQRIVDRPDGSVVIELSKGVRMIGERDDAPYFWILGDYVPWWEAHPELGLPTGNPLPTLSQDFQHGRAVLATLGAPEPQAVLEANPAVGLPPVDERREHILRQADGTAWWIDRDDRRHWIGIGEVWACLGGDDAAVGKDIPGSAIATLPLGDHAECPG